MHIVIPVLSPYFLYRPYTSHLPVIIALVCIAVSGYAIFCLCMHSCLCTFKMFTVSLTLDAHAPEGYCSFLCLSVCLLVGNSLLKRLFVLKTLSHTQQAKKVKTFVGICLKPLHLRVMPRNRSERANNYANVFRLTRCQLSPFDTQRSTRGYLTIVNNIQPCPKLCLLMPLARVGARIDSTLRLQLQCVAWPISAHVHWRSTPRVLHFSASNILCIVCHIQFMKALQ